MLADTKDTNVFIENRDADWKPIESAPRDGTVIDVWMEIHPSPRSMGMGDSFGVPDAWFSEGKWVHMHRGNPAELEHSYITHWRPKSPQ